jgi:hypothetical protein
MKKIKDGERTIRGKVHVLRNDLGYTERIHLFDGSFATGYRITKFVVGVNAANAGSDCIGKLSTMEPSSPSNAFWDWSENTEIGWAAFTMDATVTPGEGWAMNNSLVDRENMVIEDLYITVRSRDISDPYVYYYVEMEKYDLSESIGAVTMVRNRSQGADVTRGQ